MIALEWSTEKRKVSDLIPYDFNPRKLTEEKKQQLIQSLEKFNLVEIPAINTDGKIIAGHQRIKVLIAVGRGDEIIDVRVPNRQLTEKEFKEYNVTSNVQVGIWDIEILEEVFSDIDLNGLGLDVKTLPGYKSEHLSTEEEEQPFDDTPPLNPITLSGDIYDLISVKKELNHRIHCADSKDSDAIAKLMNGNIADMVWTDPPYNVKISDIVKQKYEEFSEASGEMTRPEFIQFLKDVFANLYLFSKNSSIHYICMDWKHIYEIVTAGESVFTRFMNLCIWAKDNGGMGTFYRSKHELVFIFKKGEAKHTNNFELGQYGRYRTNVWEYPSANSLRGKDDALGEHPTPKPIDMVADAMLDCSNKNQIVLDLFLGSGSALIAGEKTERNIYSQEISTNYCDLSVRRWVKYMRDNHNEFKVIRNGRELVDQEIDQYFV